MVPCWTWSCRPVGGLWYQPNWLLITQERSKGNFSQFCIELAAVQLANCDGSFCTGAPSQAPPLVRLRMSWHNQFSLQRGHFFLPFTFWWEQTWGKGSEGLRHCRTSFWWWSRWSWWCRRTHSGYSLHSSSPGICLPSQISNLNNTIQNSGQNKTLSFGLYSWWKLAMTEEKQRDLRLS